MQISWTLILFFSLLLSPFYNSIYSILSKIYLAIKSSNILAKFIVPNNNFEALVKRYIKGVVIMMYGIKGINFLMYKLYSLS